MTVKALIKRNIMLDKKQEFLDLITRMRTVASRQKGYITAEILWSVDRPEEYLVISTWKTIEDWKRWMSSEARKGFLQKMDSLEGSPKVEEVYCYPEFSFEEFDVE